MKTVLVTPLDWGLGHATRCIPIVQELIAARCNVVLAGTGDSLAVLRTEFPELRSFQIPGYQPLYPRASRMAFSMLRQLPKFFQAAAEEHEALSKIITRERVDILLSDNRYGAWNKNVYTVMITHQSNVMMPRRFGWAAPIVRAVIASRIRRFSECWIPDFPDGRLSGNLSSLKLPQGNVKFVGAISRLSPLSLPRKYDVAAILSGPEPQRSILENILMEQLRRSGLTYFVVRGKPGSDQPTDDHTVNFLDASGMEKLMAQSAIVICRSGYSSIMDLARCGKKAILIPTPGQTEQEYLAAKFLTARVAFSVPQKNFDLQTALKESAAFSGFTPDDGNNELMKQAVASLINRDIRSV